MVSVRLTPQSCSWLHCRGEPYRVIAALELYATMLGVLAFLPEGGVSVGCGLVTGSAGTDDKGDMYAVSSMMSTKFPLNVLLMELSEQLERRNSWLRVDWTPREQNVQADALSNEQFHEFDPGKRVALDPAAVDWVVLPELIEAGGGLAK